MGVSMERRNVHIGFSLDLRNVHIGVSLERRNVHIDSSDLRNVRNVCSDVDGRGYRRKG